MWMLENHTPYEAERSWVQDKNGIQHWIVVVKATYDIRHDGLVEVAETHGADHPARRVPRRSRLV